MHMSFKRILLALLLLFLIMPYSLAFDIPEPNGYVTDLTDTLSYEEEIGLEAHIQEIEDATTAEVGILLAPTTGDEVISTVAFEVGNEWGVGKKENDNGLMILVAIDDREWFMATGYGLEGTLPDAITKRVAERQFPHYFREGDYAGGLEAALDDIEGYLLNDPTIIASYNESETASDYADSSVWIWFAILMAAALAKAIWVGTRKKKNQKSAMLMGNATIFIPAILFTTFGLTAGIMIFSVLMDIVAMSGASGGGGGHKSSSSRSSWSSSSSSSSWGSSSSSGGSFGGGSFGGGGSGGRW